MMLHESKEIEPLQVANKCSEYTGAHDQLEVDCTKIHLSLQQVLSCVLSSAQSSYPCLPSLGYQSDYSHSFPQEPSLS